MNEFETIEAKIKELADQKKALEKELSALRKSSRESRPDIPADLISKYAVGEYPIRRLMKYGKLGWTIRSFCFPKVEVPGNKFASVVIKCKEMSDEQYKKYLEILEKVLDAMDPINIR